MSLTGMTSKDVGRTIINGAGPEIHGHDFFCTTNRFLFVVHPLGHIIG